MNTKFSIRHIVTLLLIVPFSIALLSAPAQANSAVTAPQVTSLHYPNPNTVADKDDKGPRKPAPKPGPRDGGDGE